MFRRFEQRSYELERLDTGDYTPDEYELWMREMRTIHHFFGEVRALRSTLFRDIKDKYDAGVSILDVGAGSGQLLRELRKWLNTHRAFLAGVEINAEASKNIAVGPDLAAIQADALQLPFCDDAFDFVFCSLFLHHLDDRAAELLLKEMRRVARRRIFVLDLNRSAAAYYFFKFVGPFFLQRFTVEDGSLSILRSFTAPELEQLARAAGLEDIRVEHSRANRLILSGR